MSQTDRPDAPDAVTIDTKYNIGSFYRNDHCGVLRHDDSIFRGAMAFPSGSVSLVSDGFLGAAQLNLDVDEARRLRDFLDEHLDE